ncbi:hypothetical protein LTR37_017220 [Vermiconidia calcicola]|uniref:Uncharacterized protein n=1 Tax=Vermiconidia calcicola TaxID=1690605 RepID=A0ACC3MLE4_9PEZI|nr:hypothetical protein LTR37_017220 [Vermiconidia calcicola]
MWLIFPDTNYDKRILPSFFDLSTEIDFSTMWYQVFHMETAALKQMTGPDHSYDKLMKMEK